MAQHVDIEDREEVHVEDSYAVDNDNNQVTVLGTMGQDPDHKSPVPWRAYAIIAICALACFQNTYYGIAPAANVSPIIEYTNIQTLSDNLVDQAYPIAGALNGSSSQRIWIVQAGAVPTIATGPIFAIISDIYGRRYVILFAWLLFAIGSIISMTANSLSAVIAGQVLSGVASGTSGIVFAVTSEVIPGAYRAYGQTFVRYVDSKNSHVI